MKAITIWQPWASLLAHRAKTYETRSWETAYRGPIAIHAAAIKVPQVLKRCFPEAKDQMMFFDAIAKGLHGCYTTKEIERILNELPTGCVVATANLVGCHKITAIQRAYAVDKTERSLGDWTPGRFAWEFSDMKLIDPIPVKGKQGLWWWEP